MAKEKWPKKNIRVAESQVTSADNRCKFDTANPSGVGNGAWRALLVYNARRACITPNCTTGAAENLNWPLQPNQNYVRPDRTFVGRTNAAGLFVFPLAKGVSAVAGTRVWTGLGTDWLNSNVCADWTDATNATSGRRGAADAVDIAAISEAAEACGESLALICVEQP